MNTTQLALLALALGIAIGAGVAAVVVAALRARANALVQTSVELPDGLTAVLAAMDDAACAVDSSGVVIATSSAAGQFGISAGTTLDAPELRQIVRAVRGTGTSQTKSFRLTRAGRGIDERLVSARGSTLGPRLILLIVRDVTEQERLDQMRTDFVANTSHELKTPVGAVSLLAEAIDSAADDPDQVRTFAKRVLAEASRLDQLTNRIMNLSRLQSADGLGDLEPVAIDQIIARAVDAHATQADGAGVEVTRGGDKDVWVRGDAQILTEAVGNLISNAISYSSRGARVGVGVKSEGDVVEIAVTDQGIGIEEADRDRVFERFYRADEARSRRTGGTGLGLAIVKHATQRHGGEVRLWSRPGRGSTFTMRLPQLDQPEVQSAAKKKRKKRKGGTQSNGSVAASTPQAGRNR